MRLEFSRETRKQALRRSHGNCEASGLRYGLKEDVRCDGPLSAGVEFDHDLPAELGGDNSLDNCRAICIRCHRIKTRNDIRQIRKADRQRDRHSGAWKPSSRPLPGGRNSPLKKKINGTTIERRP